MTVAGFAGELHEFRRTDTVTADELGLDAQFLHLLGHRTTLGIHATVENNIRLLGFDLGQNGLEVGGLVVGIFGSDNLQAGSLSGLLELVGQTLAVSGAVIDDGNGLAFLGHELAEHLALLDIIGHDAESGSKTLLRVFRVGRRRRDLRDACVGIKLGSRDGGTGIQVTNHAINLGVHQFLGDDRTLLRIGLVIFSHQLEFEYGTTNFDFLFVQIGNGKRCTAFVILAQVSLRTSHRRNMTELDDKLRFRRRRCRGSRRNRSSNGRRRFLLPTGRHGKGSNDGEGNYR